MSTQHDRQQLLLHLKIAKNTNRIKTNVCKIIQAEIECIKGEKL